MSLMHTFKMDTHKTIKMTVIAIFCFSPLRFSDATISKNVGVNYGRLGNDLLSPYKSIELIQNMKAGMVKIYDADHEILKLLSGTKLHVSIMITNDQIHGISSSQAMADKWVRYNVLAYYPDTMVRCILVGNEVLSYNTARDQQLWQHLVPAMRRIKNSLRSHNIRDIKVGTPLAMDILVATFPPSSGTFRPDVSTQIMVPLLDFLNRTKSFFFVNVYPYFPWSANPNKEGLDFALLRAGNLTYTDPISGLQYTNLLDQMLDSILFAMGRMGYNNVKLAIGETGWPNAGDIDQPGANIYNAATYNRNLVRKMTAKSSRGTPARPGSVIPTFIFSLYNENQKGGRGTERHWGLFYPDGRAIYDLDLTGKKSENEYGFLPNPLNDELYQGKIWCVVADKVNLTELRSALSHVCEEGNRTCDALAPGKECYIPVSEIAHASYAFSSYWAKFRSTGATCYFNGLANQTTEDPSHDSCKFPSVSLQR